MRHPTPPTTSTSHSVTAPPYHSRIYVQYTRTRSPTAGPAVSLALGLATLHTSSRASASGSSISPSPSITATSPLPLPSPVMSNTSSSSLDITAGRHLTTCSRTSCTTYRSPSSSSALPAETSTSPASCTYRPAVCALKYRVEYAFCSVSRTQAAMGPTTTCPSYRSSHRRLVGSSQAGTASTVTHSFASATRSLVPSPPPTCRRHSRTWSS